DADGSTRYRLLEPVRQYAQRHLAQSGDASTTRRRHAAHYLAIAEEGEAALFSAQQVPWFARLERDHDNLRTALTWAIEQRARDTAQRLAGSVGQFWFL